MKHKTMKLTKTLLLASCSALLLAESASAANIIWQTPQGIADSSEVNTSGTLFTAQSSTGANVTVNGVVFSGAPAANFADPFNNSNATTFIGATTFTGPDAANYQTLIGGGRFYNPDSTADATLTFSGLTIGNDILSNFGWQTTEPFQMIVHCKS
jgi:hypothetical protein